MLTSTAFLLGLFVGGLIVVFAALPVLAQAVERAHIGGVQRCQEALARLRVDFTRDMADDPNLPLIQTTFTAAERVIGATLTAVQAEWLKIKAQQGDRS